MTEQEDNNYLAENWHNSLSQSGDLCDILAEMEEFKLDQEDVPLIIKLVENPKYKTSQIFSGAVDLFTHDCIHVLLGRGLLPKDEAFVIGYTMGSAKKMTRWRRNLFMFCCKYLVVNIDSNQNLKGSQNHLLCNNQHKYLMKDSLLFLIRNLSQILLICIIASLMNLFYY